MKSDEQPDSMSLREVYLRAVEKKTPAERCAFLDGACGDNLSMRSKVEALLKENAEDSFLEEPAIEGITTIEVTPLSEEPGTIIGRYKLLQKVGEGGMGVVYMAEQTEPVTRKVALKIIKLGMDTKQVVARFEAERQALAMMDHPNIAKVLDAGATDTGRPYFVMELVRGVPITEYCDKNKLSTQERLNLFIPVCQAIQHAHQKGVIHRDIKPSNVMVTLHDGNAVPKVIDFGIAKATNQKLTEKTLFTNYAQMIGTPAYMSPEQAEMSGLDVDTRTDVYSLGVLLYELLTGTTPFLSKELLSMGYGEMQKVIAEKEPPKPSTRLSTMQNEERTVVAKNRSMEVSALGKVFQGDLDWIVMKALEKDRTHRYETVNGLVADIRRHLGNEPVSAAAPTFTYQLQKFYRRNRKYMRVVAAVAALLLVAVLFSTYQAVRATRARILATTAQKVAQLKAEEARQAEIKKTELHQQADTRAKELRENSYFQSVALAYQETSANRPAHALKLLEEDCPVDLRNWEWNHVRHRSIAGDHPVIPLGDLGKSIYNMAVSPNGRNIALIVGETLQLAELTETGDLVRPETLSPVSRPIHGIERWLSFSPDSRFLASAGNGGTVTIWDVAGRTAVNSFQVSSDRIDAIAYHPSGEEIAVVSSVTFGSSEGTISLLDARSGRLKKPIRSGTIVFSIAYSPDGRWLAAGMVDQWPHFVRVLDVSSGEQVSDLREHLLPVFTLAFSPDSRWLVSGGDTTVKLWNVSTWRLEQTFFGHSTFINSVGFTADGTRLVSAGWDREVKVWDPFKAREILSLSGHRNAISAMALTSRGLLVSGDLSGDIRIWNAALPVVRKPLFTLTEHKNRVAALAWDPHNAERLFSVAEVEGFVWDANTGQRLDRFPSFIDLTISRDGRHIIHPAEMNPQSGGEDAGNVVVVNEASSVARYDIMPNEAKKMYFCADISVGGELLAGGTSDGEVQVWKRETRTLLGTLLGHHASVKSVRFSPDGHYLVSLGADGEILRWDATRLTESQQAFQLLSPSAAGIGHFGFSSDGKRLATGDGFSGVLVLDVQTRKRLLPIPNAHGGIVTVARFSPDDRWIASGGSDNVVRLWDAATGDLKETLIGHTAKVNDVAFSPDGKRLASAGWDQTVKIWALDLH